MYYLFTSLLNEIQYKTLSCKTDSIRNEEKEFFLHRRKPSTVGSRTDWICHLLELILDTTKRVNRCPHLNLPLIKFILL